LLAKEGVNVLVVRRIGEMAEVHMRARGIAVFTGCDRISDALDEVKSASNASTQLNI